MEGDWIEPDQTPSLRQFDAGSTAAYVVGGRRGRRARAVRRGGARAHRGNWCRRFLEGGAIDHDRLPPRAGAEAQSRMLAKSKVKTVVAVSCNPATLARDARTLIDGGYTMGRVTPIDQFRYTPHIECVTVFNR